MITKPYNIPFVNTYKYINNKICKNQHVFLVILIKMQYCFWS